MDNKANQIRRIEGMLSFHYQHYRSVNDDDVIRNELVTLIQNLDAQQNRSSAAPEFNQGVIALYRNLIQLGDTGVYKLDDVACALLWFIKEDIQRANMLSSAELLYLIKLNKH